MNYKSALEQAKEWVDTRPKELDPDLVEKVLLGLNFVLKRKTGNHTKYLWFHSAIESDDFKYGILALSSGHSKGNKTVIRIGSVTILLKALQLVIEAGE